MIFLLILKFYYILLLTIVYVIQYTEVEVIHMPNKEDIMNNLRLELRKGTLVLAVLSQLREKHYGYSLVETLNNKGLSIDQNTLYPLLRRLDQQGLLEASWEMVDPRPRKYYHLSELGSTLFAELKKEYNNQTTLIQSLIEEE